jgi:hypothetical protein
MADLVSVPFFHPSSYIPALPRPVSHGAEHAALLFLA